MTVLDATRTKLLPLFDGVLELLFDPLLFPPPEASRDRDVIVHTSLAATHLRHNRKYRQNMSQIPEVLVKQRAITGNRSTLAKHGGTGEFVLN